MPSMWSTVDDDEYSIYSVPADNTSISIVVDTLLLITQKKRSVDYDGIGEGVLSSSLDYGREYKDKNISARNTHYRSIKRL